MSQHQFIIKRLQKGLELYNELLPFLEAVPTEWNNEQLYELHEDMVDCFNKLRNYIEKAHKVTDQQVQQELLPLIKQTETAIEHLRTHLPQLQEIVRKQLNLEDPDNHSDGTLTGRTTPFSSKHDKSTPPAVKLSETKPHWIDSLFLPPVNIPTFTGNIAEWLPFRDLFFAMIDIRQIDECLKLFHLRGHLTGEPAQLIKHLGNANKDYKLAWEILDKYYGDPKKIAHHLRSAIIHYKITSHDNTSLYKAWTDLYQLFSQLLNIVDENDNAFLAQVIESKFPRFVIQKVYKLNGPSIQGHDMLEEIGEVLRKETDVDLIIRDNHGSSSSYQYKPKLPHRPNQHYQQHDQYHKQRHFQQIQRQHQQYQQSRYQQRQPQSSVHQIYYSLPEMKCLICNQTTHPTYQCNKPLNEKLQIIRTKGLCNNCLKSSHSTNNCPSNNNCRHCNKRHNSSICYLNEHDSKRTKVTFQPRRTSAMVTHETTHTANPANLNKSIDELTSLLMIGEASIKSNHPCLIFLDSGSTKTYVNKTFINKHKIEPCGEEPLSIRTFGNNLVNVTAKLYNIPIQRGPFKQSVRAYALNEPTGFMKMALIPDLMESTVRTRLVQPDLLIGMDYLHLFDITETIKLPSGFQFSQTPFCTFIHGRGHCYEEPSNNNVHHAYPTLPKQNGTITAYLGPMWAGKTTMMLKQLQTKSKNSTVSIKHSQDNPRLITHDGLKWDGDIISTESLMNILPTIQNYTTVGIDEAQFFIDLIPFINALRIMGKDVFITGILADGTTTPVRNILELFSIVDKIKIISGRCNKCSQNANITIRTVPPPVNPSDIKEWIGGEDKYTVLCYNCHQILLKDNLQKADSSFPIYDNYQTNIDYHHEIQNLWKLELIGIQPDELDNDDEKAIKLFQNSIARDETGRYTARWPWKTNRLTLGSNFKQSLARLQHTLRKLKHDPALIIEYTNKLNEQLQTGIIEIIHKHTKDGFIHYIPHQPVLTPEKTTTKFRLVFDASCKSSSGKSLNDHIFRGPVYLPDIIGLLLRFRYTPIPIWADVEKAFHQINLHIKDRDSTRFLWVKDPTLPAENHNLVFYRFARIPFGVIASPFILAATIKHHLSQYTDPLASKISKNSYVDNILIENDSVEQAISSFLRSRDIFRDAKMNLREFVTNHPHVQSAITKETGETPPSTFKTLGILWNITHDTITMPKPTYSTHNVTKRAILHDLAKLYDPLGIFTPLTLHIKLLLQQLWQLKLSWDQPIPELLQSEWKIIAEEWNNFTFSPLPRIIPKHQNAHLHVFCDASQQAYAAVVYIHIQETNEVHFLLGKCRIKPIKETTIPKMELLAATIGSRLVKTITKELSTQTFQTVNLWTDSQIVYSWLHSLKTLQTFINNRTTEIRQNMATAKFLYVPTDLNPADIGTRRCTITDFKNSRWITGPEWLSDPWPQQPPITTEIPTEEVVYLTDDQTLKRRSTIYQYERFGSWSKIVRTTVLLLTFLMKIIRHPAWQKKSPALQNPTRSFLWAEIILFRQIQLDMPPTTIDIKNNHLFFDTSLQLYRCNTRLTKSALPNTAQLPIFLPRSHQLTLLYIQHVHTLTQHANPSTTICLLRQRVWIPRVRSLTKRVLYQCVCRKLTPFQPSSFPPLPSFRTNQSRPFQYTGIDFTGPFYVRLQHRKKIQKSFICLFTCLTSRAVHIEVILNQSTTTFLQATRRFIARRGNPSIILSDNARVFKTSSSLLRLGWDESPDIQHYFSNHSIEWKFITEASPWKGGTWERMIGLTKTCLHRTMGKRILHLSEFITLTTEIEALINSRPLTYVNEDNQVIRPIDCIQPGLLIGTPLLNEQLLLDPDYNPIPMPHAHTVINLWRSQQLLLNSFWKKWRQDYLTQLIERKDWEHTFKKGAIKRPPRIGEIVHIKDSNPIRGNWLMGKIVAILSPQKIRLRVNNKIIDRGPQHLYPLELDPFPEMRPTKSPSRRKTTAYFALIVSVLLITAVSTNADTHGPIGTMGPRLPSTKPSPTQTSVPAPQTNVPVLNTSTITEETTTESEKFCTADDCTLWRWDCCTAAQKIGTVFFVLLIIAILPTLLTILSIIWCVSKNGCLCGKRLCRRIKNTIFHRTPTPMRNHHHRSPRSSQFRRKLSTIVLATLVAAVYACSETTSLTTKETNCIQSYDNKIVCSLKAVITLTLKPVNETICVMIKTDLNGTIGRMEIRTDSIQLHCVTNELYYTRDYVVDVFSVHRCHLASGSQCEDDFCETVEDNTEIISIPEVIRQQNGYSDCVRSCNCITCDTCLSCTPSCLFYRYYEKELNPSIYSIHECPTWEKKVIISYTWIPEKGEPTSSIAAVITPGTRHPILNHTITAILQSVTTPEFPILSQQFVTDMKKKTVWLTKASPSGNPIANHIGTLQCASPIHAMSLNCLFPKNICECTTDFFIAQCSCAILNPQNLTEQLPIDTGYLRLYSPIHTPGSSSVIAEIQQHADLQAQFEFADVSLATLQFNTHCQVQLRQQPKGCRSCLRGADAQLFCSADAETTVNIRCSTQTDFSFPCGKVGKIHQMTIHTISEHYNEQCNYSCSLNYGTFNLSATLYENITAPFAQPQRGSIYSPPANLDLSGVSKILSDIVNGLSNFIVLILSALFSPFGFILIAVALSIILCYYLRYRNRHPYSLIMRPSKTK